MKARCNSPILTWRIKARLDSPILVGSHLFEVKSPQAHFLHYQLQTSSTPYNSSLHLLHPCPLLLVLDLVSTMQMANSYDLVFYITGCSCVMVFLDGVVVFLNDVVVSVC